jgi:glycosyltransferase involved in cell wall biosynthesis
MTKITPREKSIINLIQDVATPHNNVLISAFARRKDVTVKLWYSQENLGSMYPWTKNLSGEHFPAIIYGRGLNLSFLWHCVTHPRERFVIVGWMNINTKLLHIIFFLLRRPFNHWTDLPASPQGKQPVVKRIFRSVAYALLKYSRATVFGVGKSSIAFFKSMGFGDERVINLPIFVQVRENSKKLCCQDHKIRRRYGASGDDYLISAGSRLIFEKGYDLLVDAVGHIPLDLRRRLRVVIVGSGVEYEAITQQIVKSNLSGIVRLVDWMDIEDFNAVIASSDIFIHPARFDAYGGTILAMAQGVAVIGSTGAGAAVDRIEDGLNGFLYGPTDTQKLAELICRLLQNPDLRRRVGEAALNTAQLWPPSRGADILIKHSI